MVVVGEPAVKGRGAFSAGAVDGAVGPAGEHGADEALGLAGFEPATELRDGLQAGFEWVLERAPGVGLLRSGVL
jgi:hypothetical protein